MKTIDISAEAKTSTALADAIKETEPIEWSQAVKRLPDPKDMPPGDKVVVTRMVFEAMCARAGVNVTWRDGQPWMTEDRDYMTNLPNTAKTMEKRVRQLEQENARLEERLKSAARRDDNWRDIMKEVIERERAGERLSDETRAIQSMRDNGITEADQKAVEALTGVTDVVKLRDMLVKPKRGATTPALRQLAVDPQEPRGFLGRAAEGVNYNAVSLDELHTGQLSVLDEMVKDMVEAKSSVYDQFMRGRERRGETL